MKKHLMLFSVIAFAVLAITGCSKDDDDNVMSFDNATIVGSWTITSVNGTSIWKWITVGEELTFYSNGVCSTGFSMENAWKLESGKIKTYYKETQEPMLIYSLISIDGSEYKVRVDGTLDESNESVIIKMRK